MTSEMIERLRLEFDAAPILRAASLPSKVEVEQASQQIKLPFSKDYQEFLLLFGAAMVGPFPIYGLRPVEVMGDDEWSVVDMTNRFRNEGVPGSEGWAIISMDHSGNPVGMDVSGVIWIHDHDHGGLTLLAPTFESYLHTQCLEIDD